MRTWIRALLCRLRHHPVKKIEMQSPGKAVEVFRCSCGDVSGMEQRTGQYPLRRGADRVKVTG